jgi:hypothetical protein
MNIESDLPTLAKVAAAMLKIHPNGVAQVRQAFEKLVAKSVAPGGQSSTMSYLPVPSPTPEPAKPKPISTKFKNGDAVTAGNKNGEVAATIGDHVLVLFDDGSVDLFPDREVQAGGASKVLKSFVPRTSEPSGTDGTREWLESLSKTIERQNGPFGGSR